MDLKKQLKDKLEQDDRNLTWFWKKYLGIDEISYQGFIQQISGTVRIRPEIKKTIEDYLK